MSTLLTMLHGRQQDLMQMVRHMMASIMPVQTYTAIALARKMRPPMMRQIQMLSGRIRPQVNAQAAITAMLRWLTR